MSCNCNCNNDYPCGWQFSPSIYISAEAPLDANGMSVKLKYGDGLYLDADGNLCSEAGSGGTGNVDDVKVNGASVVSHRIAEINLEPYALSAVVKNQVDSLSANVQSKVDELETKVNIISGQSEAAVDDVKVNGISVVANKVASIDLTPYALSANVQSQVNELENKIEVISADTKPYSAGSGIDIANQVISVKGGNVVNSVSADTTYVSGSSLVAKVDGNPTNVTLGNFGFINNRRILDTTYNSFTLLENVSVPRGVGRVNVPIVNNAAQLPAGDSNVYGLVMVDNAIDSVSVNPVQNAVIKTALDGKANGAFNLVSLTQAEYDALPVKDPATIYFIQE